LYKKHCKKATKKAQRRGKEIRKEKEGFEEKETSTNGLLPR